MDEKLKTNGKRTVLVLGAGFTKAFLPSAPLLTDDYEIEDLLKEFRGFSYAKKLLELERKMSKGQINIERLMTRLDSRMPYDFVLGGSEELQLLLVELMKKFKKRLYDAMKGIIKTNQLKKLAEFCASNRVHCITFNYDDLFDKFLYQVKPITHVNKKKGEPYWHPDGGYGFFTAPAEICVHQFPIVMDITAMLLLKLHGSINWRVRHGYPRPFPVEAIVHQEDWLPEHDKNIPEDIIERHLEPEPFMVPPVLIKTELRDQPVLRVVWTQAYNVLKNSERVVFVGYSFPQTDISAVTLFGETLQELDQSQIHIVNLAEKPEEKQSIKSAYQHVFPRLTNGQFDFRGALDWVEEFINDDAT